MTTTEREIDNFIKNSETKTKQESIFFKHLEAIKIMKKKGISLNIMLEFIISKDEKIKEKYESNQRNGMQRIQQIYKYYTKKEEKSND